MALLLHDGEVKLETNGWPHFFTHSFGTLEQPDGVSNGLSRDINHHLA